MNNWNQTNKKRINGFSLTELIAAVAILAILGSVAIPSHLNQLCKSKSSEAEAVIGSIMTIIAAYSDETGIMADSWEDLNSISTISTADGIAKGNFPTDIILASKNYKLNVSEPSKTIYTIEATPIEGCDKRNIKACINLSTGRTSQTVGNGTTEASTPICG